MPKNHSGVNAPDMEISVPVGTQILDENGLLANLVEDGQRVLIARGGKGGVGTFKGRKEGFDDEKFKGEAGEEKIIRLILSLIADVGLVGLPNAGKSSLLAELTRARPKIGNYPFTTLEPNIGMMGGIIIADIPGLIEGASKGVGLGTKFLKHIQKTRVLLHCIEVTDPDPLKSYETVRAEFEKYNLELLEKKEIILLTKIDLVKSNELEKRMHDLIEVESEILPVSVMDEESLGKLKAKIEQLVSVGNAS